MAFDGTLAKEPNGGTARKIPVAASVALSYMVRKHKAIQPKYKQ